MVGPIQSIRHTFSLARTNNPGDALQAAVVVSIRGRGRKRLTHITALAQSKGDLATVLDAKVMVIAGNIGLEEPTDTVSDFYLLEPSSGGEIIFECGAPATNTRFNKSHTFIGEDIVEVEEATNLSVVLIARADAPVILRLFVNGCLTTTE